MLYNNDIANNCENVIFPGVNVYVSLSGHYCEVVLASVPGIHIYPCVLWWIKTICFDVNYGLALNIVLSGLWLLRISIVSSSSCSESSSIKRYHIMYNTRSNNILYTHRRRNAIRILNTVHCIVFNACIYNYNLLIINRVRKVNFVLRVGERRRWIMNNIMHALFCIVFEFNTFTCLYRYYVYPFCTRCHRSAVHHDRIILFNIM
jgi:hypothetical protein